jgi:hypothetical protein
VEAWLSQIRLKFSRLGLGTEVHIKWLRIVVCEPNLIRESDSGFKAVEPEKSCCGWNGALLVQIPKYWLSFVGHAIAVSLTKAGHFFKK